MSSYFKKYLIGEIQYELHRSRNYFLLSVAAVVLLILNNYYASLIGSFVIYMVALQNITQRNKKVKIIPYENKLIPLTSSELFITHFIKTLLKFVPWIIPMTFVIKTFFIKANKNLAAVVILISALLFLYGIVMVYTRLDLDIKNFKQEKYFIITLRTFAIIASVISLVSFFIFTDNISYQMISSESLSVLAFLIAIMLFFKRDELFFNEHNFFKNIKFQFFYDLPAFVLIVVSFVLINSFLKIA